MGPPGTGRYASGKPSARVEGALADGISLLCSGLLCSRAAPGPPGRPRLAP